VEKGLMKPSLAADKMDYLLSFNSRLPKEECVHRIQKWRRSA
jgi:hypothetical protein